MSISGSNADWGGVTGEKIPLVGTAAARASEQQESEVIPETQQIAGRIAVTELVNDGGNIDRPFPVMEVSSYWANMLP